MARTATDGGTRSNGSSNGTFGSSASNRALASIAGLSGTPYVGGATSTKDDPPVYWGGDTRYGAAKKGQQHAIGGYAAQAANKGSENKTTSQAKAEWYNLSSNPQELAEWAQLLVEYGLIGEEDADDYGTLQSLWMDAVDESAGFTAAGRKVTPRDAIKMMGVKGKVKEGSGGSGRQSGTFRSRTTSTDLSDPASAKSLINEVLSQQLGREARPDEIAAFTKTLNDAERANPSVSDSTQVLDGAGNQTNTTTTSGGLSGAGKQQTIVDKARSNDQYAEYQAATTYYGAFMDAIGGGISTPGRQ